MTSALAQHDGVGQSSRSRRDMHWGSSSEIKPSHLEHPSGRVPCPACDWVVDDGCPDEHEENGREHTTALRDSSNGKSNRDGCEHALVDGEEEIRDLGGAHGWCSEDVPEADVLQVSDVLAGGVGEGERVAPEEPLEGDDGGGHDGEPD